VLICEKPLADNIRQSRKIARLAAQTARRAPEKAPVIITNHERRYSQDYINAKAILEKSLNARDGGRLGRLLSVRANLCMGKNRRLLDMFWHDGTHLADAIMYLSGLVLKHRGRRGAKLGSRCGTAWLEGELRSMTGTGDSDQRDRIGSIPGIPVLIEIGAGRDHLIFEIEFSCEKGRLRIGNGIYEIWESVPSPYAENFRSLKRGDEVFEGPTGYFANMLKDAAACLRENGRQPLSSAADGLRVIEYLNSVRAWRSRD
jgi:predicted dehydrogenase